MRNSNEVNGPGVRFPGKISHRMPVRVRLTCLLARWVQKVWILVAATPLIVIVCALKG